MTAARKPLDGPESDRPRGWHISRPPACGAHRADRLAGLVYCERPADHSGYHEGYSARNHPVRWSDK